MFDATVCVVFHASTRPYMRARAFVAVAYGSLTLLIIFSLSVSVFSVFSFGSCSVSLSYTHIYSHTLLSAETLQAILSLQILSLSLFFWFSMCHPSFAVLEPHCWHCIVLTMLKRPALLVKSIRCVLEADIVVSLVKNKLNFVLEATLGK